MRQMGKDELKNVPGRPVGRDDPGVCVCGHPYHAHVDYGEGCLEGCLECGHVYGENRVRCEVESCLMKCCLVLV